MFNVSLWRRPYARNVRLYFPYRQYTNLSIFCFVKLYNPHHREFVLLFLSPSKYCLVFGTWSKPFFFAKGKLFVVTDKVIETKYCIWTLVDCFSRHLNHWQRSDVRLEVYTWVKWMYFWLQLFAVTDKVTETKYFYLTTRYIVSKTTDWTFKPLTLTKGICAFWSVHFKYLSLKLFVVTDKVIGS